MTKKDLIALVQQTDAAQALKNMVISYIEKAHSIGFAEGMIAATKIQSQVFELLGPNP